MPTTTRKISPGRLAANRANATRSTGPRTPQGKAHSAQNARKHSFTAANFAVIRLEELDAVARLKDDLVAVYQPLNSQELFVIERLALAQQALLRSAALETGLFISCLNETLQRDDAPVYPLADDLTRDIEVTKAQNRAYALAEGFQLQARRSNGFPLFLRYQAQTERLYRRAVEELERLRALRAELPNEPIMEPKPEENTPLPTLETNPPPTAPPTPASPPEAACRAVSAPPEAACRAVSAATPGSRR